MKSLQQHINESFADSESINESFVAQLISNLSKDEIEILMGAVGSVGLVLTSVGITKLADWLKKHGGQKAKDIISKLEQLGTTAGNTVQQK